MKKKIIIAVVIILPIAAALYLLWGLKIYMDQVPTIEVEESLTFSANSEIPIQEIARIEKARTIKLSAQWADGSMEELYVDKENLVLQIGNKTGECQVFIAATGENAETTSEKVVIMIE